MIPGIIAPIVWASAVTGFGLGATSGNQTLYASPTGTGSACTSTAPCSLMTARGQLSGRNAGTINLQTGTYRLGATLALTSADSGETWQAAPGASPVLVGSTQITGWTSCASGCPAGVNAAVYKAAVPNGTASRQLYVNGTRGVRANSGYLTPANWTQNGTGFAGTNTYYTAPDLTTMVARGHNGWRDFHCPIATATSSQLNLAQPCWGAATTASAFGLTPFVNLNGFIENSLTLLTQSGFWYLDTAGLDGAANTLYFWPRPNDGAMSGADVELPTLSTLVTMTGVRNFAWKGIAFEYATWNPQAGDGIVSIQSNFIYQTVSSLGGYLYTYAGSTNMAGTPPIGNVTLYGSSGVTFSACTFAHLGSTALSLQNGTNNTLVDENVFTDLSMSAILVGDAERTVDQSNTDPNFVHDNTISRNFVFGYGADDWNTSGMQSGWTTNTKFVQNEILFGAYSGLESGGFQHTANSSYANLVYDRNLVQGVLHYQIFDGGALYMHGLQQIGQAAVVTNNVVSNQGKPYGMMYLDTATSYTSWTGNVIEDDSPSGSCLALLQTAPPDVSKYNSLTSTFSNDSVACGTFDASNTFATPTTITGIHDPLVSSQLAAAGTPLRDPVISIGATVIPNVGGAFRLVDGIWSGNSGTWNGHANQVIDWGASKNVTSVEVAYAYGNDDFAEHLSYSLQLSNDPTFATGVTTIASVDSAGTYNGYYYGSMDWFPVAPAVNARYLRVVTATATFDEILVHGH